MGAGMVRPFVLVLMVDPLRPSGRAFCRCTEFRRRWLAFVSPAESHSHHSPPRWCPDEVRSGNVRVARGEAGDVSVGRVRRLVASSDAGPARRVGGPSGSAGRRRLRRGARPGPRRERRPSTSCCSPAAATTDRWRSIAPGRGAARCRARPAARCGWRGSRPRGHAWPAKLGVDVWHGPHYTLPLRARVPTVVTVHDLTFLEHPEWHERAKVLYFRRMIPAASHGARRCACA